MRGVGRFTGAMAVAAVLAGSCGVASARDAAEGRERERILYFAGSEVWAHGSFAHGGLLWAPQGLEQDGFVFKLMLGGGSYRYRSGALNDAEVDGRQFVAFALPGWRFKRGTFTLTTFAGLDIQRHRLTPFDPGSRLNGTAAGLRGGVEIWCEPTPGTMFAADASASTVGGSYSARAAFGWSLFDIFYIGPELQAFAADDQYRQFRTGLHVTALRTGPVEWSAAAGYSRDSDDRAGVYARIGLIARQ